LKLFKLKKILILAISCHLQLNAERIVVKNTSNRFLEFTYIHNLTNENWSITNNRGIALIPPKTVINDSLRISRFGYSSIILVYRGEKLLITLSDNPVAIDGVEAVGYKHLSDDLSKGVSISKKSSYEHISHKEFLERLPGVQIRSIGGPGSITTVSLNGGPTSQTKVTINGFDLTNVQTGVTDLSQLPPAFINEARLIINGEKLISSGSQNGVLELNNRNQNNSISSSIGSFDSYKSNINFSWNSKKYITSFFTGYNKTKGNYKVSWRDRVFNRSNNHFYQNYGSLQFIRKINPAVFVKGFSLITNQTRGVPGLLWSPLEAHHNDHLGIFASSLNWFNKLGRGSLSYFLKITNDYYKNPLYNIESNNQLSSSTISFSNPIFKIKQFKSSLKIEVQSNYLKTNTIERQKYFSSLSSSSQFITSKKINFWFTAQKNFSKGLYNKNTNSFVISYNFNESIFLKNLTFSSSSHFRYPTFNDLFWQPGGNPQLNAETGKNNSISIRLNQILNGNLDLNIFNSKTYNLIQWRPIQSYWQAENIDNVIRYGITGYLTQNNRYFNTKLSFGITESYHGKDKRRLRYTPKNIGTIFFEKNIKNFTISTDIHYISEMISAYSYPKNSIIPKSSITSIHLIHKTTFNRFDLIFSASAKNIFDTEYESSKGYPEPRKNITTTITLNQKRMYK